MINAHKYLDKIEVYKPGKARIEGSTTEMKKLSSNENALKSSKKAIKAYKEHYQDIHRYADGSCEELRAAIASKHNIDKNKIVCGAGSDEIIALLTQAYAGVGDEIIYSKHGFLMYPISAKRVGATAIAVAEKNLKADVDAIIAAITNKTKIIFIANPNNPTGSYLDSKEITKLIQHTPKSVLIILDHAYDEFAAGARSYPDAVKIVNENENVVMTRTFSKIYGLASLRIGWSYSSNEIANIINKVRGPFNVGGPAQVAAIAALQDEVFFKKSQRHNKKWLRIFFKEARYLGKIKAYPSIANFILFDFNTENNCQIANKMFVERGFIVREMAAYHLPSCLRVTIGTSEENNEIIEILREINDRL
ncbi:MAG: histidinol-phosphate transaminase [Candidatus Staskawiczbacteria bacterium]|nr:histidinol-phosphate transaminase [Candidatus Staskawiczbacteria bacterium]